MAFGMYTAFTIPYSPLQQKCSQTNFLFVKNALSLVQSFHKVKVSRCIIIYFSINYSTIFLIAKLLRHSSCFFQSCSSWTVKKHSRYCATVAWVIFQGQSKTGRIVKFGHQFPLHLCFQGQKTDLIYLVYCRTDFTNFSVHKT